MTAHIPLDQMRFAKALEGLPARFPLFIDGRSEDAADGRVIERVSPAFGTVVTRYPHAGPAELDRALDAARRAFDAGPWPRASCPLSSRWPVRSMRKWSSSA